jgi:hypothetical protein
MLGFFLGVKDGFELEGVKVHKNPQFKKMKKRSNFTWHVLTHGYHEKSNRHKVFQKMECSQASTNVSFF